LPSDRLIPPTACGEYTEYAQQLQVPSEEVGSQKSEVPDKEEAPASYGAGAFEAVILVAVGVGFEGALLGDAEVGGEEGAEGHAAASRSITTRSSASTQPVMPPLPSSGTCPRR
jgi:hypothetical protein